MKRIKNLKSRKQEISITIKAPEVFTLVGIKRREFLLKFIEKIKKYIIEKGGVFIDFRQTRKMFSDGTLYFKAQLDLINKITKTYRYEYSPKHTRLGILRGKMLNCNYPRNSIVEQVLQHVGIFDMIGKAHRRVIDHESVKYWYSETGEEVDARKIEVLNDIYLKNAALEDEDILLYNAVSEAMSNCIHHAYPKKGEGDDRYFKHRTWWSFSQKNNNALSVAFCDLGFGIPKTLKEPENEWGGIRGIRERFDKTRSDGDLIRIAFQLRKSQTAQTHRGNGLSEMKGVLSSRPGARLVVQSGMGLYFYNASPEKESILNAPLGIQGTLIFWNIPLLNPVENEGKVDHESND